MSKKQKKNKMCFWLTEKIDCAEIRFIQCGNSLLLSKSFQSMTIGARWTYFCMAMESAGKPDFVFPRTAAKKYGIPSSSLRRYTEELRDNNFIAYVSSKNLRTSNMYHFSHEWKNQANNLVKLKFIGEKTITPTILYQDKIS